MSLLLLFHPRGTGTPAAQRDLGGVKRRRRPQEQNEDEEEMKIIEQLYAQLTTGDT